MAVRGYVGLLKLPKLRLPPRVAVVEASEPAVIAVADKTVLLPRLTLPVRQYDSDSDDESLCPELLRSPPSSPSSSSVSSLSFMERGIASACTSLAGSLKILGASWKGSSFGLPSNTRGRRKRPKRYTRSCSSSTISTSTASSTDTSRTSRSSSSGSSSSSASTAMVKLSRVSSYSSNATDTSTASSSSLASSLAPCEL